MSYSIFWARLIGLYAVILSLWSLLNIKSLHPLMIALSNNVSISMVMGSFTIFLGLAIVISHSIWRGWPILVTILGYWITFKGIVILFFPHWINSMLAFWEGKNMIYGPIPALIVGLVLLFFGFFYKKSM